MAGIVAAETNNSIGIAGVGYPDGVKVMPVSVLDASGTGYDADIIAGLNWAVVNGADVVLMAFSSPGQSSALQDAVELSHVASGVVVVASVANDGSTAASYPAGYAGVIGVAATDQNDNLAASSNSGASAYIAAPGVGITTLSSGGGTTTINGTSAAAAHVAGAAALLRAQNAELPLSNGQITARLDNTADPAGAGAGSGRLNLHAALTGGGETSTEPGGTPGEGTTDEPFTVAAPTDINPGTHQGQRAPLGVVTPGANYTSGNITGLLRRRFDQLQVHSLEHVRDREVRTIGRSV